jgi:hypothetical protein
MRYSKQILVAASDAVLLAAANVLLVILTHGDAGRPYYLAINGKGKF